MERPQRWEPRPAGRRGGRAPARRGSPARRERRCAARATGAGGQPSGQRLWRPRPVAPRRPASPPPRAPRSRVLRRVHGELPEVRQLAPQVFPQPVRQARLELAGPLAGDAPEIAYLLQRHGLAVIARRDPVVEQVLVLLRGERLAELLQLLLEDAPQLLVRELLVDRRAGLDQPVAMCLPRLVLRSEDRRIDGELVVGEPLIHLPHVLLGHVEPLGEQLGRGLETLREQPLLLLA